MALEKLQYRDFVAAANLLGNKNSLRLKEDGTGIATSWHARASVRYHDWATRTPDEVVAAKKTMLEALLKQADHKHGDVVKKLIERDIRPTSDGKTLSTLKAGHIKAAEKQNDPMTPIINDREIRWAAYGRETHNPAAPANAKPTGRSLLELLPGIATPLTGRFKENACFGAEDLQSLKANHAKVKTMDQFPHGLSQEIERALHRQALGTRPPKTTDFLR